MKRNARTRRGGVRQATPGTTKRAGWVLLAIAVAITVYAFNDGVPFVGDGLDRVELEMADASNVRPNQLVRISGVDVGKVVAVDVADGGRQADVTIGVEPEQRDRLRADARATARFRTVLGRNLYIDLEPGNSTRPLQGSRIGRAHTAHQVEVDQVLQALPKASRLGARKTFRGLATAFADPPPVRRTARSAAPAFVDGTRALAALRGSRTGDLGRALSGTSDLVRTLARSDAELAGLIDGAGMTLAATAARRADLGATLRLAPAAMAEARAGLRRIDGTLERIDPVTDLLRPQAGRVDDVVDRLAAAIDDTTPTVRRARPLLRSLRPALRQLQAAAASGVPLMNALEPTVDRVADRTLPFLFGVDEEDTKRRVFELIGPFASILDSFTSTYDSQGHSAVFQAGFSTRALDGILPCKLLLANPSATELVTCENLKQILRLVFGPETSKAGEAARTKAMDAIAGRIENGKAGR